MWKFSLDKNFAKSSYLCIAKIFGGIEFHQCGKGHHILYVIINTGQKICVTPMRVDGEIGKNFHVYSRFLVLTIYIHVYCRSGNFLLWNFHMTNFRVHRNHPLPLNNTCFGKINFCSRQRLQKHFYNESFVYTVCDLIIINAPTAYILHTASAWVAATAFDDLYLQFVCMKAHGQQNWCGW